MGKGNVTYVTGMSPSLEERSHVTGSGIRMSQSKKLSQVSLALGRVNRGNSVILLQFLALVSDFQHSTTSLSHGLTSVHSNLTRVILVK